ncbi:polysaccharide biosynthesis protein [bacterium]|nr:polysaccharide biosynthesis protein [bacterium]
MSDFGQKAARGMMWNFVGKFAFMILKYAESILLVRLLGAGEYGVLGEVLNTHALIVMFVGLGLGNALLKFLPEVREQKSNEREFLLRFILLRTVFLVGAAIVVGVFGSWFAETFVHDPTRGVLFVAAGALIVTTGLQNILTRVLVSRYHQKELNLIQAGITAAYLALAAAVLAMGGGILEVMLANVATAAVGCVVFGRQVWNRTPRMPDAPRYATVWSRVAKYSASLYAYDLLNLVLANRLDILLIGLLHKDMHEVTAYILAYNFATNSLSLFTKVFAEGFTLSAVADVYAKGDMPRVRRVFSAVTEYTYLFVTPIAVGGAVLMGDLFRLMYGEAGEGAIAPAVYFLLVMGLGKYQGVTANFLGAMDKERALITSRAIFGVLNVVLNLLWIPKYGALGACWATCVATVVGVVFEAIILHRVLRPDYPMAFWAKVGGVSLVMGAAVWGVTLALPPIEAIRVVVGLIVGAGVYAVGVIVTKPVSPNLADLVASLKAPGAKTVARLLGAKG